MKTYAYPIVVILEIPLSDTNIWKRGRRRKEYDSLKTFAKLNLQCKEDQETNSYFLLIKTESLPHCHLLMPPGSSDPLDSFMPCLGEEKTFYHFTPNNKQTLASMNFENLWFRKLWIWSERWTALRSWGTVKSTRAEEGREVHTLENHRLSISSFSLPSIFAQDHVRKAGN